MHEILSSYISANATLSNETAFGNFRERRIFLGELSQRPKSRKVVNGVVYFSRRFSYKAFGISLTTRIQEEMICQITILRCHKAKYLDILLLAIAHMCGLVNFHRVKLI